jgi:hypothetical protein
VQVWHKIKKVRKAPSKNFNLYICISMITASKKIIEVVGRWFYKNRKLPNMYHEVIG